MNNGKIFQFIWLDLAALSILSAVSEFMGNGLLGVWNSDFYFSFTIAITVIATIRWGVAGVVVGVAGGIPGIFFSDMTVVGGILFYAAANAFIGIPILLYGKRNRDRIVEAPMLLLLYVMAAHLSLAVGKGIVIFLLTGETTGVKDYFGATLFITVIDLVVCMVLRMRKGLICDMRYYFAQGGGERNEKNGC